MLTKNFAVSGFYDANQLDLENSLEMIVELFLHRAMRIHFLCFILSCLLIGCSDVSEVSSSLPVNKNSLEDDEVAQVAMEEETVDEEPDVEINPGFVEPEATPGIVLETPPPSPMEDLARKKRREEIGRIRESQENKRYQSLTLGDRSYVDATVTEISDMGVKVSHQGGLASVAWNSIQPVAQKALGYDPEAFADVVEERQRVLAEKKAMMNSPEYQARKAEEARARSMRREEKMKANLAYEIEKTTSEIERGEEALKSLKKAQSDLESRYREEDRNAQIIKATRSNPFVKNRYGGIKTSSQDREKNIAAGAARINAASHHLEALEDKLSRLKASQ